MPSIRRSSHPSNAPGASVRAPGAHSSQRVCLICGGTGRLPYRDGSGVYLCAPCRGSGVSQDPKSEARAASRIEDARGDDRCEGMATPAAGDASDSQHGRRDLSLRRGAASGMSDLCSRCRGTGWVWSYPGTGTPGRPHAVTCPNCRGWKTARSERSAEGDSTPAPGSVGADPEHTPRGPTDRSAGER